MIKKANSLSLSKQVREEVKKQKSSMTDEELFSAPGFKTYITKLLQAAVNVIPGARMRRINLNMSCDSSSNFTACTDNNTVMINTLGPWVRCISDRYGRYQSIVGHIVHETCHCLFTDFFHLNKYRQKFFSKFEFESATDEKKAEEIQEYCDNHPVFHRLFASQASDITNLFEDVYIENMASTAFAGFMYTCLRVTRRQMYETSQSIEQMLTAVLAGQADLYSVIVIVLQLRAFGYKEKTDRSLDSIKMFHDLYSMVDECCNRCKPFYDDYAWQSDMAIKCRDLNDILCVLFDYMPKPKESNSSSGDENGQGGQSDQNSSEQDQSSDNGESDNNRQNQEQSDVNNKGGQTSPDSNGSSNESQQSGCYSSTGAEAGENDLTEKEVNDLLDQISKARKENGIDTSDTAKGEDVSACSQDPSEDEKKNVEQKNNLIDSGSEGTAGKSSLNDASEAAAKEKAIQVVEDENKESLTAEAKERLAEMLRKRDLSDVEWQYKIIRISEEEAAYYQDDYESLFGSITGYVKPAKNRLLKALKDHKEDDEYDRGYRTGKFDVKSTYHSAGNDDGRYFKKKREPGDVPDVVFSLLIDCSGSMHGKKMMQAKKTALLLDNILRMADIPFQVIGHDDDIEWGACKFDVKLRIARSFESFSERDSYRIAALAADGGNADGAAIAYCCESLQKRPEKNKVLIVISDGLPAENGFHQDVNPEEDTKLTVEEYSRKGISIFGAVIDGDYDRIASIYGKRTMDLTNIDRLPVTLSKLVERYIIKE